MRNTTMLLFFFFNDTATTEIYTLSLHDALPISRKPERKEGIRNAGKQETKQQSKIENRKSKIDMPRFVNIAIRSEEHTSELQSQSNLVCRLLLEKKKRKTRSARVSSPTSAQSAP